MIKLFITSSEGRRLCFYLCLAVCLSVRLFLCRLDYSKSYERISMIFFRRSGRGLGRRGPWMMDILDEIFGEVGRGLRNNHLDFRDFKGLFICYCDSCRQPQSSAEV